MTEINFYACENSSQAKLQLLRECLLRAQKFEGCTHIHCKDEAQALGLQKLAWSLTGSSFFPSRIVNAEEQGPFAEKLTFGIDYTPEINCDNLINVSSQSVPYFSRFAHMSEIIIKDEPYLSAGRKRFTEYKHKGYDVSYSQ